ncbi:hypothetical protein HDU96_000180 [Phlyctochytrium bullatum]|nr:hypothetical protein HDU96_000180 [Phlyctochytrium bullatum]
MDHMFDTEKVQVPLINLRPSVKVIVEVYKVLTNLLGPDLAANSGSEAEGSHPFQLTISGSQHHNATLALLKVAAAASSMTEAAPVLHQRKADVPPDSGIGSPTDSSNRSPPSSSDGLLAPKRRRVEETSLTLRNAAVRNDAGWVAKLLAENHDPYEKDADGRLPIELSTSKHVWSVFARWMAPPTMEFSKAVMDGDGVAVRLLLAKGADPVTRDSSFSAFHWAVMTGNDAVVRAILDSVGNSEEVLEFKSKSTANQIGENLTPLQEAVRVGNLELVKLFVQRGADLEASTKLTKSRALHVAAFTRNRKEIFRYLLDHGADLSGEDVHGNTPLHAAAQWGDAELCSIILERDITGIDAQTSRKRTCSSRSSTYVKVIIEVYRLLTSLLGPDLATRSGSEVEDNATAGKSFRLTVSVPQNHSATLSFLEVAAVSASSMTEATPVLNQRGTDWPADTGVCSLRSSLVTTTQYSSDAPRTAILPPGGSLVTPTLYSSDAPRTAVLPPDSGIGSPAVNPNPSPPTSSDAPLLPKRRRIEEEVLTLHEAALRNDVDMVAKLLEDNHDPYEKDLEGRLPIELSTSKDVWSVFTRWMATADMNAFLSAVRDGDGVAVRLLLAKGADPTTCFSFEGYSAFYWVILTGNESLVRAMLDSVKTPEELVNSATSLACRNVGPPLNMAIERRRFEIVKLLLRRGADLEASTLPQKTRALHKAARYLTDFFVYLVNQGAELWARDADDSTPLHIAASCGAAEICKIILERDPRGIDSANRDGHTALHLAVIQNKVEVVKVLLKMGADRHIRIGSKKSPYARAQRSKKVDPQIRNPRKVLASRSGVAYHDPHDDPALLPPAGRPSSPSQRPTTSFFSPPQPSRSPPPAAPRPVSTTAGPSVRFASLPRSRAASKTRRGVAAGAGAGAEPPIWMRDDVRWSGGGRTRGFGGDDDEEEEVEEGDGYGGSGLRGPQGLQQAWAFGDAAGAVRAAVTAATKAAKAASAAAAEHGKEDGRLAEALRIMEATLKQEGKLRRELEAQLHQLSLTLRDLESRHRELAGRLDATSRDVASRVDRMAQDLTTQHQSHAARTTEHLQRDRQATLQTVTAWLREHDQRAGQQLSAVEARLMQALEVGVGRAQGVAAEAVERAGEAGRVARETAGRVAGREQGVGLGVEAAAGVAAGLAGKVVTALEAGTRATQAAAERMADNVVGAVGAAAMESQREAARLVEEVGKGIAAKLEMLQMRVDGEARRLEEEVRRRFEGASGKLEEAKGRVEHLERRIGVAQASWDAWEGSSSKSHIAAHLELRAPPSSTSVPQWPAADPPTSSIESRLQALEAWRRHREETVSKDTAQLVEAVGGVHQAVMQLKEEHAMARSVLTKEIDLVRKEMREESKELRELMETTVRRCARAMVIM